MCTSFIVKALDGSPLYGRTMEWGGFDLKSELVLMPRGTSFTPALSAEKQGMTWNNRFGFIAINPANLPYAMDGMNETGQTQWTVIGDIRNRRYYCWTEHNQRMRLVDLTKLDFDGDKVQRIPLDKVQRIPLDKVQRIPLDEVRAEDVQDRTQDFS